MPSLASIGWVWGRDQWSALERPAVDPCMVEVSRRHESCLVPCDCKTPTLPCVPNECSNEWYRMYTHHVSHSVLRCQYEDAYPAWVDALDASNCTLSVQSKHVLYCDALTTPAPQWSIETCQQSFRSYKEPFPFECVEWIDSYGCGNESCGCSVVVGVPDTFASFRTVHCLSDTENLRFDVLESGLLLGAVVYLIVLWCLERVVDQTRSDVVDPAHSSRV